MAGKKKYVKGAPKKKAKKSLKQTKKPSGMNFMTKSPAA
jgi:hypothetical protein